MSKKQLKRKASKLKMMTSTPRLWKEVLNGLIENAGESTSGGNDTSGGNGEGSGDGNNGTQLVMFDCDILVDKGCQIVPFKEGETMESVKNSIVNGNMPVFCCKLNSEYEQSYTYITPQSWDQYDNQCDLTNRLISDINENLEYAGLGQNTISRVLFVVDVSAAGGAFSSNVFITDKGFIQVLGM